MGAPTLPWKIISKRVRAADKVVLAVQSVFDESLTLSACRAVL
jgi:hypothetical protein